MNYAGTLLAFHLMKFVSGKPFECNSPGLSHGVTLTSTDSTENSTIIYSCQNKSAILIPSAPDFDIWKTANIDQAQYTRTCRKGSWSNSLPRCAEHISSRVNVASITTYLSRHHKGVFLYDNRNPYYSVNTPFKNQCVQSSHTMWKIAFTQRVQGISFVEIASKTNELGTFASLSAPAFVKLSKNRSCKYVTCRNVSFAQYIVHKGIVQPVTDTPHRPSTQMDFNVTILGYYCPVLNYSNKINAAEQSLVKFIEIEFDWKHIKSVCDIKLYQPVQYRCGNPDPPLSGKVMISFGRIIMSKPIKTLAHYQCNPGFKLTHDGHEGNNESVCGPDGQWMGDTPSCRPNVTCPTENRVDGIEVTYTFYTYWKEELMAIEKTVALFPCKGLMRRIFCGADGHWSQPGLQCEVRRHTISGIGSWIWTVFGMFFLFLLILVLFCLYYYYRQTVVLKSKDPEEDPRYEVIGSSFYPDIFSGHEVQQDNNIYEAIDVYEHCSEHKDDIVDDSAQGEGTRGPAADDQGEGSRWRPSEALPQMQDNDLYGNFDSDE